MGYISQRFSEQRSARHLPRRFARGGSEKRRRRALGRRIVPDLVAPFDCKPDPVGIPLHSDLKAYALLRLQKWRTWMKSYPHCVFGLQRLYQIVERGEVQEGLPLRSRPNLALSCQAKVCPAQEHAQSPPPPKRGQVCLKRHDKACIRQFLRKVHNCFARYEFYLCARLEVKRIVMGGASHAPTAGRARTLITVELLF